MYEQSARWNALYDEYDPVRRQVMLEELMLTEPDDGANEYRQLLFATRHGDPRKNKGQLDRYLFQFVSLVQVYRSSRFFKRSATREVRKLVKELRWDKAAQYGEAGERALYWELRNAAMRYLKTCEGSHFNRGLFGLTASGEGSRQDRICKDIWQMTEGLAERTGLVNELRIWNEAVMHAYLRFDGSGAERLKAYQNK